MGVVVFAGIAVAVIGLLFFEHRFQMNRVDGDEGSDWARKYVEEREEEAKKDLE